jgi:hypothetical protein
MKGARSSEIGLEYRKCIHQPSDDRNTINLATSPHRTGYLGVLGGFVVGNLSVRAAAYTFQSHARRPLLSTIVGTDLGATKASIPARHPRGPMSGNGGNGLAPLKRWVLHFGLYLLAELMRSCENSD